ncbi:unnamed protein product, partial [Oikopleura dioica]
MVNAEANGNCNDGYTLELWWAVNGDFAPIQVQNINLTGVELSVQTVDVRSGGVWIKEIPGAFLRTVHDEVVVSRKGISAACNTNDQDCSFSYLNSPADITSTSAAQVNTPSTGESSFTINFDAAVTITFVKVGEEFPEYCLESTQCRFVQTADTSVEVFFQSLPYGNHKITAFTEFGALLNTNDFTVTVNPPASGVTVVPTSGPTYGGNMVTVSGKGVGIGEQIPLFDGIASKVISSSADQIVCLSPTIDNTDTAVDISFDNRVILGSFSYAGASYDINTSRVDWSVKGNQEITFDLSSSPADLEFGDLFFGDEWIATLNFANNELVYLSAPSDAKSEIAVRICLFKKFNGETVYLGWTSTTFISYRLTIDSITPNQSSTAGGRILTINGRGFGTNADDIQVEIGNIPCDVESASWQEITCKTRARYETHHVVLAGFSWFPQRLTVRANDRITWSWISGEEFTVQIGTTDSLNNEEKLFDEILSNIVSGSAGTVETIVTAEPGVYFYTSGDMDGYSIYANGQIEVLPARNYEDEVVLKLAGFTANTNPSLVRDWRKWTGNTDCATNGGFVTVSNSETVPASCTDCATHTYSYDLTPEASAVEFDGVTLTVHSNDFADQTDCPGAFNIVGRSAHGEIKFNIDSVSATEVTASLPPVKANWPFGEDLQIEVSEFGRGNVLINSHQVEKFTVSPRIDSVTPRIGSTEGGALVTLTGDGLKFDRYVYTKVSCCSEIITHTKSEIVCISSFGKPGSSAGIGISWYEKEPEDTSITLVLAGTLGGSYTMKTVFEFEFTEIPVEDDVSEFVHQSNDFTLDVSFQFPTTPVNLRAFMLGQDDVVIELTNTYLDLCQEKACFRSQWHANGYTTQVYTVRLVSENYGTITYGNVFPKIAITSMQYSEGSQLGGHKIRLTTTIEKISDTQIEIVSPGMHGDITGEGDRAGVTVIFDNDEDTELMIYFLDSVSNNYAYDWTLTPGVQSVSSNILSIGDTLSITLNGTEDGSCTGLEVFIGEAPATVSACNEAAGTTDVIVGPQGDGDYALTVFNPEVGWATIADSVNKVFTMAFHVTSISPSTGSYGGGVLVTLTGSGLGADTFDGRLCRESLYDCVFPDFETAICRTPNIGVREHDSFVCTYEFYNSDGLPHGQSRMASFGFTYQLSDTAVISDIVPVLGGSMGGTQITIYGSGFVPLGQTVTIGQSACDIVSETTTSIVCDTNSHPTSSKEDVVVEITSSGFAARDPNAPASFTGEFRYIDRWSSIFTWGCTETPCENKPVDYDIAVIPAGVTVLLDESTPLLSVLLIQGGTLLWDRLSGIKLRAQYVLITDEGRFELGTEEEPFCLDENGDRMTADIKLFGHSRSVKLPIYGAKVFAVRSGTLDLHGCPIGKSYSVLSKTAHAGDSELVLKDVVETAGGAASNWQAGDEIAIATTGGRLSLKQTERKVIHSVSGNTVTLTTPLEHRHIYHLSTWDGDELEVTAEVALLSRNVRLYGNRNMDWYEELPECTETQEADESATQTCFQNKWGDEVGSDEFGSHLIMHYIVRGRIRNIEVFHAGQGGQLGRYALHFHNSGNQPESYIASNSIHDTFNRAVTMHGVWNATIEWNVAFRCKGHNFFIEDAVEEDLIIQYNLAMMVKPSQSLLNTDQKATGFWITNTYNTIQHNRVAGSAQMGFWVNAPSVSGHANADCPPIVRSHCPIFTPVKTWYNNTGHDIGLYGFWVFTTEESVAYAPSTIDCQETWPPGEAIFEKGTFWNCKRGMEFAKVGDNVKVKDFTVANNELGGLSILETRSLRDGGMFDEYFTGIIDSKTIGYIDATIPELSLCTRFGVETPWKPDGQMTVDGIKFFNFDVSYEDDENVEPGWCSDSSYKFDCGRTSTWSNVQWFDSPRKFAADWEHETILIDMDGSLTGMGAPGRSVSGRGCVPPTEPPPTTPPIISDYCSWSDPACWDDGVVPADGAIVTIANDKDVTVDVDITVDVLYIEGTLRVSNESDITINARVILVNTGMGSSQATRNLIAVENGNFFVGSEDSPICDTSVTINLTGNEFGAEYGAPAGAVPIGSKAIGNLGGLKLFGCPRALRSSSLAADIIAGDNQLTLAAGYDASSLQLGDELGIAPTSFDMREAESVVVTGVSGSIVTFDPPAQFDHLGNAEFAAEIIVLTRNVKITGASDSSDFFGGRIVSMDVTESSTFRSGWAQVSDVEFFNMGQFGHTKPEDLRVPLAFYFVGLQDLSDKRRSFVTNSAFHHSYNGGVVTGAGSDGVLVEGNVFFNIVADAIEDLGENTRIVDNTIIFCQYHQQKCSRNTLIFVANKHLRLFFFFLGLKMYAFFTKNAYILSSAQKRGHFKFPGCNFHDLGLQSQVTLFIIWDCQSQVTLFITWDCQSQVTAYNPKKHLDKQSGYTTLAGRSCAIANTFINYKNQECGTKKSHVIISTPKTLTDHAPVLEIRETTKTSSTKANAVYFHRPQVSEVSLDTCVDMPCDGDRRRFVKDIDGSLTNDAPTGQEVAIISQSEYHWEGVDGFPWSDSVDQRFGIGDYRIPASMLTDIDGNVEDPYVYAPNRGISRPDSCEYQTTYNAYICSGSNRGFLNFESMDFDTEVRRIAPIGIRSSSGFLDLGNGPSDTSCCAGYSCSLRITNNYFVVNCGETYDFHTKGTMPTKVRFSLQQLPSTCKIGIKMHTMRQNRQDVFLNGDNIIYSNQYDFANDTWRFPHPSMISTLDEPSGSNYFDRAEQMLHFTLGGGDQLEIRIANSIILTLDITTEMSIEEFYASSDLPYLLAAMLGLDPSQVKIVQVVREANPSRTWTHEHTTVTRELPENSEVMRVMVEFSNEFGSEEEDSVSSDFGRLAFSSSAINNKNVGNRLVAAQMEGRLESDISQASGGDLGIVATTLTAQALSGETPAWYEKGTEGESQTVLSQLGIDPDELEGPALQDLIVKTALLNNKTDLINSTNVEEQAVLQETMDRTTKAVSYDQVPTKMAVVQQIPQKVFVGSRMRYPIKIAMLDADSQSMTEVGYMGDPMRITISSSPDTILTNTEAYFVPGNGIASFDFLKFAEAGRYSFSISLIYTGEADIFVEDVQTISFEVTADVPSDLAFDVKPPTTVLQRRPFSSAIVMYDSAGNLMTGDILTASDPWRVCARPVNASSGQELLGDIEVPFESGVAQFENLQFKEIQNNVAVRFFVCYAAGADVSTLRVTEVISETLSVTNINECESALHKCDPNASCTDTEGGYECACNDGFTGNGFVCIEFVNECEDGTHECSEYATCNDAPLGYTCACDAGFSGDGYVCEDEDECFDESDWCDREVSVCVNELGTFSCNCNSGYVTVDAKRCRDIDECLDYPCD